MRRSRSRLDRRTGRDVDVVGRGSGIDAVGRSKSRLDRSTERDVDVVGWKAELLNGSRGSDVDVV